MSEISSEVFYTKDHEWVSFEENIATVGVTDHAQTELGDITFVELPEDEMVVNVGDEVCTIESVKASSPVYAPVAGKIIEVNSELEDEPGAVNSDPYGAGWIFRIEMEEQPDKDELLQPEDYEDLLADL